MCQNNCNIEERENKPLTQIELGKIESKLDEGYNAAQITQYLGRDASCIQKEIKNFSIIKPSKKNVKIVKITKIINKVNYVNIAFQVKSAVVVEIVKLKQNYVRSIYQ